MQMIPLRPLLALAAPIALAIAASAQVELPAVSSELVTDVEAGIVETMDQVMLRESLVDWTRVENRRLRNGRQGTWEIPGPRHTYYPHSGEHYVVNRWGDTRMGIGFPGPVDLHGAWFVGQGPLNGAWARGLQVVGYRAGERVATTEWFLDVDDTPSWFAMDLSRVDRIEIVAAPFSLGSGFYGMDDLAYTDLETGRRELVDFEDLVYEDTLTGSGYRGLTWETGTGVFEDEVITMPPPRTADADGQLAPNSAPPGNPAGAGGITAFVGNGTLPVLLQSFQGPKLGDPGGGAIPPDTHGSVGIDHFMTSVNVNVSVYEKTTGNRVVNTGLGAFLNAGFVGDPRVVFDPDSQRWFLIATNFNNRIYLAVSSTSDPTGSWFKTSWVASQGTDSSKWPDYPTLGVDSRWVIVTAAMFGSSVTHTIFALDKAPLVAANQSLGTISAFRNIPYQGALQPCVHWEDAGEAYVISVNGSTSLTVRTILPPVGSPSLATGNVTLSNSWNSPPAADVLGSNPLDTLDGRLINAVYRLGSIWTTHTIQTGGRASSRWYEIDPVNKVELQLGTVRDNINNELFLFNPSICVNSQGHAVLGGTVSSPNQYAGAFYTGRLASDPPGEMAQPFEYKPGAGAYNQGGGVQRWGDYSMTSADPVDDTVWTMQEFARVGNDWGNMIAQLGFSAGCPDAVYCDTNPDNGAAITIDTCDCSAGSINIGMTGAVAPDGNFGYVLVGQGSSAITNPPGAQGDLCLGGSTIGRYNKPSDLRTLTGGTVAPLDVLNAQSGGGGGQIPTIGGNLCSPTGQTWNFQWWYRNGMNPSRFSEAMTVTFH